MLENSLYQSHIEKLQCFQNEIKLRELKLQEMLLDSKSFRENKI